MYKKKIFLFVDQGKTDWLWLQIHILTLNIVHVLCLVM